MRKSDQPQPIPDLPAAALLSFIKQVTADSSWDAKRLAEILNVKAADVPQLTGMLEMLGYAEPVPDKTNTWRNTAAGNTVSGAKPPRFKHDAVLKALGDLRARVEEMNAATTSPFQVTSLIAFGDFLDKQPKAQAADVGVGLTPAKSHHDDPATAVEHKREEHFLTDLKAKSTMLHLHPIEDWMRNRSHQDLLHE